MREGGGGAHVVLVFLFKQFPAPQGTASKGSGFCSGIKLFFTVNLFLSSATAHVKASSVPPFYCKSSTFIHMAPKEHQRANFLTYQNIEGKHRKDSEVQHVKACSDQKSPSQHAVLATQRFPPPLETTSVVHMSLLMTV